MTSQHTKRQNLLQQLSQGGVADLAVIGGGATGLGVALDAALRGLRVVLLEAGDFAGGTSSRSTKLLHGGVRYLAQGDIGLVREALAERATVMHLAPHLAQPLAFVMPARRWWEKYGYGLGLKVYDVLAGRRSLGPTQWLSRVQTLRDLPGLASEGLCGGVQYWDGQFDDARLALALAQSAQAAGAVVGNYLEVEAILARAAPPHTPSHASLPDTGPRYTLDVRDALHGQRLRLQAHAVINATGVWVDALRRRVQTVHPSQQAESAAASHSVQAMISPSQGVHVVVARRFLGGNKALLVPRTRDGRVFFAVPWLGSLVLGTTDTPTQAVTREPRPYAHELAFILDEAARVLTRPVTRHDVKSVWVGLRPLVKPLHTQGETKTISREHTIVVEPSGVVTVTGGKWTTYRVMAEDVLHTAHSHGLLKGLVPLPESRTATVRLVGAPTSEHGVVSITEAPGVHLFGSRASEVEQLAQQFPGADRVLGMGLTEAMVRYAARHEWAMTVEDMLARRWRALFLDARQAEQMAAPVAELLHEELGSDPQLEAFLQLCKQYRLE